MLETTWTTDTGGVTIVDLMPIGDSRADIVRRVIGVEGSVTMRHEWVVRLGYGKIRPWVRRQDMHGKQVITAVAGPDRLILRGPRLPRRRDGRHVDEFEVHAGEELTFSTTWVPSHHELPEPLEFESRSTRRSASGELGRRVHLRRALPRRGLRSLLTLRLLTHGGTGGIVAAVTTSLPEDFGGERNWDYRFCWLRDASLTLESLLEPGYANEARLWRDWLLRAAAGDPARTCRSCTPWTAAATCRSAPRPPPGLRRLDAGADRQRRRRAAPDRRARRGDDRARDGPRCRRRRRPTTRGRCSGCWSTSSPSTGTSPTTGSGRSAVRCASSRTPG